MKIIAKEVSVNMCVLGNTAAFGGGRIPAYKHASLESTFLFVSFSYSRVVCSR